MPYEHELEKALRHIANSGLATEVGLVSLGGSHAYGLSTPDSDIDLRGFAMPTSRDILMGSDFGQIETMRDIDMTIYSLAKACELMAKCNPNMVEMLGLDADAILVSSTAYETLRSHPEWFLSKRAAYTFGGYATAQLRRIKNAMARDQNARYLAKGEIRSLEAALMALPDSYPMLKSKVDFSFDDLDTDDEHVRIMVTVSTKRVPATELAAFARQLDSARKSADTIGKNRHKESSKLAKHASHLIRLLHMGCEILVGNGINTRRTEDRDLLLDIKEGKWLHEKDGVRTYDDEFWELLESAEAEFSEAKNNTCLPDRPNLDELNEFIVDEHRRIVETYR